MIVTAATAKPFTIGASRLDAESWLLPDAALLADLAEKRALLAGRRDVVFRQTPGSEQAQREVRDMIAGHVVRRFPQLYRRVGGAIHITGGEAVDLADGPPLEAASRLVQEDLCIMHRAPEGWLLSAACLCFPSSWSLAEKIGHDMAAIHGPVPGFAGRMHDVVARMFDSLKVELPLLRFNWSVYGDGKLHHPEITADPARFPAGVPVLDVAHLRIERQTLRRLPGAGDILFTIRICAQPLRLLLAGEEGRALNRRLRGALADLTPDQARYKGIAHVRERLVAELDAFG